MALDTNGSHPTHATILSQLRELVWCAIEDQELEKAAVDLITPETELISLPLDSLATVELIGGIEQTWKIYISEDNAFEFVTVGDLIMYIDQKLAARTVERDGWPKASAI